MSGRTQPIIATAGNHDLNLPWRNDDPYPDVILDSDGEEVASCSSNEDCDFIVKAVNSHASLKSRIQELTTALELAEYVSRKDSLTEHERLESARTVICHALPPKSAK
jgi:ankyrin repeat protein